MTAAHAVRPAVLADAGAIARVHVAAWQHAYRGMLPAELLASLSVAQRTQHWHRQLAASQGAQTWVAGDADEPVRGFASAGPSRDADAKEGTGELYALYVHPDAWRTGMGSRLLAAATMSLVTGYGAATLWVLDANARARRFYERHGWRPDGARQQEVREDAVLEEVRYRLDR